MTDTTTACTVPDPATEPTVTVERAAALLGISRGQGYEGVRSGDIPSLRIGRRIVVPVAPLRRKLGSKHEPPAEAHPGDPGQGHRPAARADPPPARRQGRGL